MELKKDPNHHEVKCACGSLHCKMLGAHPCTCSTKKAAQIPKRGTIGHGTIGSKVLQFVRAESGQGTTEYAILVGVLVVIAIVAVVAFRGRVEELWGAIADGINSL